MKPCQPKITLLWIASTSMMATAASIRATTSQHVPLASTTTMSTTKEGQQQQQQRQLQLGGFFPTLPPIEGGGDGSFMEDKDSNGIPDWLDASMPDWGNMDWANFSMGDMDWNGMNWTTDAWGEFLNGLLGGANSGTGTGAPIDFCPILESAIGMGQSFGIAGNCTCDGNLGNGLMIDCDFKECMTSTTGCTDIGLNFTFDDVTGVVNASICVDAPEDTYEEFCFSYKLDMPATGDAVAPEPSCQASYAGKPCGCTIEGLCVALDCSAYLPGAKMDTCQYLSFVDAGDATSLVPNFPIFNETFNGSFSFGSVNWTNLDWDNLDWDNFGFDRVNWTDANATLMPWGSIFNTDVNQSAICSILSGRVLSMDPDMVNQDCTCTGGFESGFSIQCSFEEECVATTSGDLVAISKEAQAVAQESTICAEVALTFEFNNLGSINGSLCADFAEDVHPTTCINYSIPIADQESQPQCQATYGDQPCKCSINESLCVKVDCSAYEASAVMDTCQVLSLQEEEDVATVIPRFALPSQAADDTTAPPNNEEGTSSTQRPNQSAASEANEVNADSASHSRIVSLALVGASILSIITL